MSATTWTFAAEDRALPEDLADTEEVLPATEEDLEEDEDGFSKTHTFTGVTRLDKDAAKYFPSGEKTTLRTSKVVSVKAVTCIFRSTRYKLWRTRESLDDVKYTSPFFSSTRTIATSQFSPSVRRLS